MKSQSAELSKAESRFNTIQYILVGALYGFLAGNAFAICGALVDRWLHPDLPLGFDWSLFGMRWGWIALGLALTGAVTSLFVEKVPGLLAGAAIAGFVALASALLPAPVATGIKVIVLIFGLIPMFALSVPVTFILRWLVDKHAEFLELQRAPLIIALILLTIVLGAGGGYFLKMSHRALDATRFMHQQLQTASQDLTKSPFQDLPDFPRHAGMSYELFERSSESSTEGFDVRARYADGYTVECTVVIYSGDSPYITDCQSTQE